jgi:hypothetical protein
MNLIKKSNFLSTIQVLMIMIVFLSFSTCTARAESPQKSSDQLLSEIMDMHSDLVTNEIFLAQAKMLGAYLEAAKSSDEPKKVEIYTKVLNILKKIKASSISGSTVSEPNNTEAAVLAKSPVKEKQEALTKYIPGAALLEIFKTDSIDKVPDLVPIIRTLWKQNLACTWSGNLNNPQENKKCPWLTSCQIPGTPWYYMFLVPQRWDEIGAGNSYVARFSFYYEAKQSGKYGFNIMHGDNACKLTVGGVDIAKAQISEPAVQGVCSLEKGFHRVEFWLVSGFVNLGQGHSSGPLFAVKVLAPDAPDAVPITKDMMLMKEDTDRTK